MSDLPDPGERPKQRRGLASASPEVRRRVAAAGGRASAAKHPASVAARGRLGGAVLAEKLASDSAARRQHAERTKAGMEKRLRARVLDEAAAAGWLPTEAQIRKLIAAKERVRMARLQLSSVYGKRRSRRDPLPEEGGGGQ